MFRFQPVSSDEHSLRAGTLMCKKHLTMDKVLVQLAKRNRFSAPRYDSLYPNSFCAIALFYHLIVNIHSVFQNKLSLTSYSFIQIRSPLKFKAVSLKWVLRKIMERLLALQNEFQQKISYSRFL